MRIRQSHIIAMLAAIGAVAAACSQDQPIDSVPQQEAPVPDYDHPISIAIDNNESRATHELKNDKLKSDCFGLYAYFTGESEYPNSAANGIAYLSNHKFECKKSGSTEIWHGNPEAYYPLGNTDYLTFVAYAPYDNAKSQLKSVDFKNGTIDITYAPSLIPEQQIDFCVADPIFNQKPTSNSLSLIFKHMLTHVAFYAKVTGDTKGNDFTVDKLTLKHVLGEKVLRWTPTPETSAYEWVVETEVPETKYVNYVMTRTSAYGHLHYANIANLENEEYVCLQNESGELYLLPQTLNGATVEIEYSLHRGTSSELLMSFVTEITMPTDIAWGLGQRIRYNMDINISDITQVSIVGIDDGPVGTVKWESVNPSDNLFTVE